MGLQEDAKKKNVRISKMQPGNRLALLSLATGKRLGDYADVEEVRAAIKKLPKYVAPKEVIQVAVGWSDTFERKEDPPRPCPNGYGFDCFCLDPMEAVLIFCPVIGCQRLSRCLGVCEEHYQATRLLGRDMSERAVEATGEMMEEYLILDGETDENGFRVGEDGKQEPGEDGKQEGRIERPSKRTPCKAPISTYDRAVANLAAGTYSHINLKYSTMLQTEGYTNKKDDLSAVADLLGVTIRFIGSGEEAVFAAFDKDGLVLAQDKNKAELLALFAIDFGDEDE